MTFRGRAGWATGDFLPYMFGGLAVGRMDVSRTVIELRQQDGIDAADWRRPAFALPQFALTSTNRQKANDFVVGWTAGLGMEYMLWGNVFLRGEWEYIKFMSIENTTVTDEQRARRPRLQILIAQPPDAAGRS